MNILTPTAPELFEKAPYRGEPADVWSSGILLYALLVGQFPYSHPNMIGLYEQIKKTETVSIAVTSATDILAEYPRLCVRRSTRLDTSNTG